MRLSLIFLPGLKKSRGSREHHHLYKCPLPPLSFRCLKLLPPFCPVGGPDYTTSPSFSVTPESTPSPMPHQSAPCSIRPSTPPIQSGSFPWAPMAEHPVEGVSLRPGGR
ncbi:hypothetical protein CgunFtcFv8_023075 [Champsocephalus gunnari]|uniref:Uncharacterized protein n=1 Tax=Champsocephalus gunnari TaxID=52237 RepID=A0AAN8DCJ3_CHAGU|nr:hypothetical protein CgunFtcFv8_023075 [Champsocephalus gunnari]